ncbi:FecR domain-containing protein [bacterium]|nr:FecR domain-containing protein [bacterium]
MKRGRHWNHPLLKAVGVLAAVMIWAGTESFAGEQARKPVPEAKILKVSGEARADGKTVKAGDTLRAGDRVETDRSDNSFVDIQFENDRVVRLKNGGMVLADLSDRFVLRLDRGKIFAHAGTLAARQSFKIQTPSAVAGVRGTKFMMEAAPDKTYLCVCEGKVWAKKKGLAGMMGGEIVLGAGEDAHIKPKEKLPPPVESPMMVKMTWDEFADMGFAKD